MVLNQQIPFVSTFIFFKQVPNYISFTLKQSLKDKTITLYEIYWQKKKEEEIKCISLTLKPVEKSYVYRMDTTAKE